MKIDQMRQFLEIAKNKSLSRASNNMYISQQALSSSIKKMEEELSTQLMIRTNHGVFLTEAGEYYANGFNRILEEYDELLLHANNSTEKPQRLRDVSIIANYGAMETFLADVLSKMPKEKIGKLHFQEGLFEEIIERVIQEKCELGIYSFSKRKGEPEENYDQIESITLFQSPLYVKVSEESPLAEKQYLKFEDIIEENILIYNNQLWPVNYLFKTLSSLKKGFNYEVEENYLLHSNMVRSGYAISFGVMEGKFCRQEKGIKLVRLDEPVEVQVVCFVKKDINIPPHVQFLINHLQLECNR